MDRPPFELRPLETFEDMVQAEALQRKVWPGSETDIVPAHIALAISQHGGVVLGAFDGERLVGYIIGFIGTDRHSPGRVAMARLKHCSHQMGVDPEYRGQGIGLALKVAQREAVLRQGIRLITWTYDPLLSLNAHLNIRKLGAVCNTYIENAYGQMRDALNVGIPSDRFEVDWWVTSRRVEQRLEGSRAPLDLAHFLGAGAEKVNTSRLGENGLLYPGKEVDEPRGTLALVEIPPDFLAIKREVPELALTWRMHTREIFKHLFDRGYIVVDFIYLRGERYPRSYYLLAHGEGTLG